ncbi:hypothetical protein D2N39_18015 [Gemmobacter lutimaris]|uniref:Uncharacterized protein n=1 Tax=Gemmobacter lutimaris TaxID=2306023 RepID=A0A398BLA0_9RHOB|nr:hypothetical protein D2N39_18015 [Gemmobacter lutimaris]
MPGSVRARILAVLVAAVLLVVAGAFTASVREMRDVAVRNVTAPDQPMQVFMARARYQSRGMR